MECEKILCFLRKKNLLLQPQAMRIQVRVFIFHTRTQSRGVLKEVFGAKDSDRPSLRQAHVSILLTQNKWVKDFGT